MTAPRTGLQYPQLSVTELVTKPVSTGRSDIRPQDLLCRGRGIVRYIRIVRGAACPLLKPTLVVGVQMVCRQLRLQDFEGLFRRVGEVKEREVPGCNRSLLCQHVEI